MRGRRPSRGSLRIAFHCRRNTRSTAARLRQHSRHAPKSMSPPDNVYPGLLSTKRDGPVAAFPESYIESGYEQHCLGTPNSGRSYARRAHASRSCPRSWMSPSVGSILGEQGQQPADQCRLYTRRHRTGAESTWRNSVFDTDTRSPML